MQLARLVPTVACALALSAGAAFAQGSVCAQLEAQLASLNRSSGGNSGQIARLQNDIQTLRGQSRSLNCDGPRGFLIFQGPPRPPQCDQIDTQLRTLQGSLAAAQRNDTSEGPRRQLLAALAQNNCGQRGAAPVATAAPAAPPRPQNFFEMLFGGGRNAPAQSEPDEVGPGIEAAPVEPPKPNYYRTVCVRTCDGYYFPISSGSSQQRLQSDDSLCKRLCPATEAQIFAYSDDIKNATSISGQSYMSLPNALRYRKEYVPSCSCRAPGQSWAQALAGLEDKSTLRRGDILVTEEQAREMSQPRVEPPPGTKKAQGRVASGDQPPSVPAASPAATAQAPMAPASEQPGQRAVRVIPLPRTAPQHTAPDAADGN